jgi:hypothetical protein
MLRPSKFWLLPLAAALGLTLSACDEKVTVPDAMVWAPELLSATVNDTIILYGVYAGDPLDISRFSWDVTSDGIFDEVYTNQGWELDTLGFSYAYRQPGEYLVTLQVTTVTNKMYRTTTEVKISDQIPQINATVPTALACDEAAYISATVIDDGGFKAWWDLDANGSPDTVVTYLDTLRVETHYFPGGPGVRSLLFGTLDNDEHRVEERFDIIMGLAPEWVPVEESPAPMEQGRWGHASTVHDGKIYVFGGKDHYDILDSVEIYDPVTDTWTAGAATPSQLWQSHAITWGDSIYLVGGYEPNGAVHMRIDAYHPATDSWAAYDPADTTKTLEEARIGFGLDERRHQGEDGFILLFGGFSGGEAREFSMKYDVDPGVWSHDYSNEMKAPRRDFGYVALNGFTWAAGGSENGAEPSSFFEHYDPGPKVWVSEPAMPTARRFPAMAALGNHIYVLGGQTSGAIASDILEVFDLENDSWHSGASLPREISAATAEVLDGSIYLIGGRGPDSELGELYMWKLTPWRCGE